MDSDAVDGRLVGRCECGSVEYRVPDEFVYAMNCHCSRCRAATGSAFKPLAGIQREQLELTNGDPNGLLIVGEEDANDTRCAACGSLLYSVVRDGAYVQGKTGLQAHPATKRMDALRRDYIKVLGLLGLRAAVSGEKPGEEDDLDKVLNG